MDARPKKKKRYGHLTIDQSIALLPLEFGNPTKLKGHIYTASKGNLYFKGSKRYNYSNKTWWYSIDPTLINENKISYIILAADYSGIFIIPAERFNAYREKHKVGAVQNGREDFTILKVDGGYIRHESKCEDDDITICFHPKTRLTEGEHHKILFANIGWMISYNGQSSKDKISGGGAYSDIDKHEAFNFQDLNGKCYGYIQLAGDRIDLQRIDPNVSQNEDYLDDITIVWFATNPVIGGSWIVGWYKHATVFRDCQKSNAPQRNGYGYYVMADEGDCTLLSVDERVMQIPRQIKNYPGRSNIWYADAKEIEPFKAQIIEYINSYKSKPKRPHRTFSAVSPEARAKIEKVAIKAIWDLYEGRGYQIDDVQSKNYGWDLEATNGKHRLYLEVKGQGKHEPYVRISRNEYEQMSKHKDKYRLCVVMDSLNEADIYVFLPQNEDKWVCEDDDTIELNINEQVAAIATF